MKTPNEDIKPLNNLPSCYANMVQGIREVARGLGYAIGVHGSMSRDLDLIAVPWTESAMDARTLAEAISYRFGGFNSNKENEWGITKPNGRTGWIIYLGGSGVIDLSVTPKHVATSSPHLELLRELMEGFEWVKAENVNGITSARLNPDYWSAKLTAALSTEDGTK